VRLAPDAATAPAGPVSPARAGTTRRGTGMRGRQVESVAGYLAALAIFVGAIAVVYRPVRIAPFAIVIALLAAAMATGRSTRITQFAVAFAAVCWFAGMTAAVITGNPLW